MSYRPVDAADIPAQHPVAELRDGWGERADSGGIVPWSQFDPMDFAHILPWVMLLRREDGDDPERLRYAICGEGCRQTFGFSYQGKIFGADLPADAVARRLAEFAAIRAGQGPLYSFTPLPVSDREYIDVYRGVFGLASAGAVVDRYMVVLAPANVRVAARADVRRDRRDEDPARRPVLRGG